MKISRLEPWTGLTEPAGNPAYHYAHKNEYRLLFLRDNEYSTALIKQIKARIKCLSVRRPYQGWCK
jgi:hypothetical protein